MLANQTSVDSLGTVKANIRLKIHPDQEHLLEVTVLPNCLHDLILGQPFCRRFESINIIYNGNKPPLNLADSKVDHHTLCLAHARVKTPRLFLGSNENVRPIRSPPRHYKPDERRFIDSEIRELLKQGIIRRSRSPWCFQIVLAKRGPKWRLCVDFSRTINKLSAEEAFPFPLINEIINKLAQYKRFTKFDLKSAYNQVILPAEDVPKTAFQANYGFFEFLRIRFRLKNAVLAFQRIMTDIIKEEDLKDTYVYLDDIMIGGMDQNQHDLNVQHFESVCKKRKLTLNNEKTVRNVSEISILGYRIGNMQISPDPEKLQTLLNLKPPGSPQELKFVKGLLAYYSHWISNFSSKLHPLTKVTQFSIYGNALKASIAIQNEMKVMKLRAIDVQLPLTVKTGATDVAVYATLKQLGHPVEHFSLTLYGSKLSYPKQEKEALCIVEALKHWKQLLTLRKFTLVTSQRALDLIYKERARSKIKILKITNWKLELASFQFDT